MAKPLRVLIVGDSENDASLILKALKRGGYSPASEQVKTPSTMASALMESEWDVVIADYRLLRFSAPAALKLLSESGRDLPFIVVSGSIGEDTAVEMMKAGAHDYVMKNNLKRLAPAVEREIGEALERQKRRQAEKALRDSEERLRAIVVNSPIGIATSGADRRFLSANDAFCRILGYTEAELQKMSFRDVTYPEDIELSVSMMEELDAGKMSFSGLEKRYIRKDGKVIIGRVMVNALRDHEGRPYLYIAELEDITESRQAEEALRRSEENFRNLIENLPVGVTITSPEGETFLANKTFLKMRGYASEEEIKQSPAVSRYADPKDRERWLSLLKEWGRVEGFEMWAKRKDDSIFFNSSNAIPFLTDSGEQRFISVSQDITERKKMEEALKQTVSELETFAYTAAHDLRAPLVTIESFAKALRVDLERQDTKRVEEDIKLIETGISKMHRLLRRVLEYGRTGLIAKSSEDISFREIVEESLEQVAGQLQSCGAGVSVAENFPTVRVDRVAMTQVLTNLIANSTEYRDKGKTLAIEIGHRLSDGEVVYFVRDNGMSIPPDALEKVFEPFFRGSKESQGAGLGLTIVKRIIEGHGGRVWIESEAGKGTTVCFTLASNEASSRDRKE